MGPLARTAAWRQELYLLGLFVGVLAIATLVILNPADAYIGPGLAFDQLGLRMAVGLGFGPTAVVAPLYPFYLSLFYGWIGYSHQAVLLSQALLLAGCAAATALLVRYQGLGPRYALVTGALVGLFPQALGLVRHFTPTLLVAFLWTVAIHVWMRGRSRPSWFEVALTGVLLGVALLGRLGLWAPAAVLLAWRGAFADPRRTFQVRAESSSTVQTGEAAPDSAAAGAADTTAGAPTSGAARVRPPRMRLRAALAGLVVLLTLAPWMVRNSQLHGELVFVDSTWALRWRAATIPGVHSIDYVIPGRTTRFPDHIPVLENRLALGDVLGFAAAEPVKLFQVWGVRTLEVFGFSGWNDAATLDRFPYEGLAYRVLQALLYGGLLSAAAAWLVLLRARGEREVVLARAWMALVAMGVVTGGVGDVRVFALPLLVPLAMRGLWGILVQLRVRLRMRADDAATGWRRWGGFENADPWPIGVEAAGVGRWVLYGALVVAIWANGLRFVIG